uniref:Uncharacterized protein n=1 Tax=Acrobeloides nanus TaxID=290746 RepID=A0A914CSI9_9BILA
MFDLTVFTPVSCKNCMIFGVSWNSTTRAIIYNLPYPMFILYALIFIKVIGMRCKVYKTNRSFTRTDKILVFIHKL